MDEDILSDICDVLISLVKAKEELARYNKEDYLNLTEEKHPWITVSIANHPTYLKDFNVRISDDKIRQIIVKEALKQHDLRIKKLEAEFNELLKKIK